MFTSFPSTGLIAAILGAACYGMGATGPAAEPVLTQVIAGIRQARVELCCSHGTQVLTDIRSASRALRQVPGPLRAGALADLGLAAWQARKGDVRAADQTLARALDRLGTGPANA